MISATSSSRPFDIRYKDIDIGFGKLSFVGIGNYIKGGVVTPAGGNTFTAINGATETINVSSSDAYGIGGGLIWQYDFGNKSYLRVFGLFGYGQTNFSAENLGNSIGAFQTNVNNSCLAEPASNVKETAPGVFSGSVNPYPNSSLYRAGFEFVWNVSDRFSMDIWGDWDHNNQGFQTIGTNAAGNIRNANATRNFYGVALRPVFWIADNFAIQGQAG